MIIIVLKKILNKKGVADKITYGMKTVSLDFLLKDDEGVSYQV